MKNFNLFKAAEDLTDAVIMFQNQGQQFTMTTNPGHNIAPAERVVSFNHAIIDQYDGLWSAAPRITGNIAVTGFMLHDSRVQEVHVLGEFENQTYGFRAEPAVLNRAAELLGHPEHAHFRDQSHDFGF